MKIYKNTVCHKCLLYRGRCIIGAPLLYHGTVAVHTRALISGPASVARCATGDASVLRQKIAIYAQIYARKPSSNKSAFKRLSNLEKECIRMPSDVLKKRAVLIYLQQCVLSSKFKRCLTKQNRQRRRIRATQNKKPPKATECKQESILVWFCLRQTLNTEKRLFLFLGYVE